MDSSTLALNFSRSKLIYPLSVLGGLYLLKESLRFTSFLWEYFLRPRSKILDRLQGTWAIVTGSTFGIGYGFVKELAKRKLNIVLISRTRSKLEEVASELEAKYGVKTKVIVADFQQPEKELVYEHIAKEIEDLDVTVLVNNVGIALPSFYYHELDEESIDKIIHVNVHSVNRMTRLVLPKLVARKSGVIVNLSSVSSEIDFPYNVLYAATKAYVDRFSINLSHECKENGIEVLAVAPGFVTSKMTRVRKASLNVCSEDVVAKRSLDSLGYTNRINPYWFHKFFSLIVRTFPTISRNISAKFMRKVAEKQRKKSQQEKK